MEFIFKKILFNRPKKKTYSEMAQLIIQNNIKILKLKSNDKIKLLYKMFFKKEYNKFLIFCSGMCSDFFEELYYLKFIHNHLKINIIFYSYPGYILRDCSPSEELMIDGLETVYNYLSSNNVSDKDIIFMGFSLGSAIIIQFLSRLAIKKNKFILDCKIILESPFYSLPNVVKKFTYNIFFCSKSFDKFQNYKYIKNFYCETLILHGKNDKLVNYENAQNIYDEMFNNSIEANKKKPSIYLVNDAGHNNIKETLGNVKYYQILKSII